MNEEKYAKISEYLVDETKLYQDWYVDFNQAETESKQYTRKVSFIPEPEKIKLFFEQWFKEQEQLFKDKICGDWRYCERNQEFKDNQSHFIAMLADILTLILVAIPVNSIATATILYTEKRLDRFCGCE